MADLRFDYQLLENLILEFNSTCMYFLMNAHGCSSCDSEDLVAEQHVYGVRGQEDTLLQSLVDSFSNAQDGARNAYDAFKAADEVGA